MRTGDGMDRLTLGSLTELLEERREGHRCLWDGWMDELKKKKKKKTGGSREAGSRGVVEGQRQSA